MLIQQVQFFKNWICWFSKFKNQFSKIEFADSANLKINFSKIEFAVQPIFKSFFSQMNMLFWQIFNIRFVIR